MDEYGNFLVNRIEFEKIWALVREIFFHILKRDAFDFKSELDSLGIRASPHSIKHHSVLLSHLLILCMKNV